MNITKGQGLYLIIPQFIDGGPCTSSRTFLVINQDEAQNKIMVLNVSTIQGKVTKSLWPSNLVLNVYNPPFLKPSFIKLDGIYELEYFPELDKRILNRKQPLHITEFGRVESELLKYSSSKNVKTIYFNKMQILSINP